MLIPFNSRAKQKVRLITFGWIYDDVILVTYSLLKMPGQSLIEAQVHVNVHINADIDRRATEIDRQRERQTDRQRDRQTDT